MSSYTPTVVYKTKFDGDDVTVKFRRLTRREFFGLTPLSAKVLSYDEETTPPEEVARIEASNQAATIKLLDVVADLLKPTAGDEVVNIEGLTDSANNPLGWNTVIEQTYFMPLCVEIVSQMIGASVLGKKSGSD